MKVILNKGLEFRNEDESQLNQMKNIFTKSYGNVTAESETTFEYKIKSKQELESNVDFDFEKLTHLPFQTQIFYTKLDGMKCIRVNSHQQEISTDKKEVEAEADSELLGINCVQQAAKIANRGDFRHAQAYMKCTRKYWGNNTNNLSAAKEVKDNLRKIKGVYGMLQVQNDKEELQKLGEMDKEKEPEMQSMVGTSPPFMEKIMREDGTLNKEDSASMPKNNKISYKKPNVGGKRYRSKLDDEATSKLHNMNKFSSKRKKL
mmetsp:Transcript_36748/g.36362  ORF Transcript_36748/g.36362 Transcript_36748/m.36362 type:complete len:261 (-) Transcript_36748:23-805(-)